MKFSVGISNFLEEISVLSHSIVLLHFFALITEEGFLMSLLFFGTLHSSRYNFPFLLCFSLLIFSQLFVRPPQTAILHFSFLGVVLITASSSVQFIHSVVSYSLQPHGLQHARPPCPSPAPGVYSNSCPLSQWCHPTTSSSVIPSHSAFFFPSTTVFSNESVLWFRWPKHWCFSISPSNEYSRLISFRMDWLDLPAVQGILNSLFPIPQCKSIILWHSAVFIVQLSHPYMTTGKIIAQTRWTLLAKLRLLFNRVCRVCCVGWS